MKPPPCRFCASTLTAPLGKPGVPAPAWLPDWRCYSCGHTFVPERSAARVVDALADEVARLGRMIEAPPRLA